MSGSNVLPVIYAIGVPMQFYNMFEFTYLLSQRLKRNNTVPRSLIMPIEFCTLFIGAAMWPISLPLMVVMDMKKAKIKS